MVHDSAPSSPSDDSASTWQTAMSARTGSVSTQLQDWLAARSLSTSLGSPVQPRVQDPIDPLRQDPNSHQPKRRERKRKIPAHSPSTPSGVICFALDATESLSWAGLFVAFLIVPSAVSYAIGFRICATIVSGTLAVWNTVADFWYTILSYPSDRALRRAHLIRNAARATLSLQLFVFLATRFGLGAPWVPGAKSLGWVSLGTALVISLLPITALARLLHTLLTPIAFTSSIIINQLLEYGPLYVFGTTVVACGYGCYLLIGYINAQEAQRKQRDVNQVMAELAVLRAELKGLMT